MRRTGPTPTAAALLGAAVLAASHPPTAIAAPEITVFGDSYSGLKPSNWVVQLRRGGKISGADNFAQPGAVAASSGSNTFAGQIRRWMSRGRPVGDHTVVYLGVNDIGRFKSFDKSGAGYESGVQTLDGAGADLILVQPHDLTTAPRFSGERAAEIAARTAAWNAIVRSTAGKVGASTVDLGAALGKVSRSAYRDDIHLGGEAHAVIARAIAAKLGGGARVASTLRLGRRARDRQEADSRAGRLAAAANAALAAPDGDGRQPHLAAFRVGEALLSEETRSDPARDLFAGTRAGLDHDGGIAVGYALPGGGGATLGVTISSYGEASRERLEFGSASDAVRSDAVGLQLGQRLGALTFETRLTYSDERYESARYDDLTGRHDRAAFGGRTLGVAQRVGYRVEREGFALTPWAELAHERREVDGFTLANPYLADQTYDAAPVSETLGSIGLDVALSSIELGQGIRLTLTSGLAYARGLGGDGHRVRVGEAGREGARETAIDRPETRSVALSLGASLTLGERLALDGGLALEHDRESGTGETARVALTYRF